MSDSNGSFVRFSAIVRFHRFEQPSSGLKLYWSSKASMVLISLISIWQPWIMAEIPDAPQPQNATPAHDAAQDTQEEQTKRILGIIPSFRAVYTTTTLPPQSAKKKFITATEDSFDYSAIFVPTVLAVYSLKTNGTPEFGQGAEGYGRYF